jgi:hypothetical protein
LLREGLIWRVGDGRSINIWGDRWIPSPTTNAIYSPNRLLPMDAKVCCLFGEGNQGWNVPLLQELFNNEEVIQICSVIHYNGRQPDSLIWNGTRNGFFSVRSAYHLGKDIMERRHSSGLRGPRAGEVWRKIWRVRGPKVVQVFLWKACHDILPTWVNFHCRKIIDDLLCPLCLQEEETTGHIFWSCPSAQDVWMECSRKLQKFPSNVDDFHNILTSIMGKLDEEEVQLCAMIARLLWLRRNTVIHAGGGGGGGGGDGAPNKGCLTCEGSSSKF